MGSFSENITLTSCKWLNMGSSWGCIISDNISTFLNIVNQKPGTPLLSFSSEIDKNFMVVFVFKLYDPTQVLWRLNFHKAEEACDYMSRFVRKLDFCLCENKGADQLRGNRKADQRLCFRYTDSSIPLLLKSEISGF